jgi:hypothetical protein
MKNQKQTTASIQMPVSVRRLLGLSQASSQIPKKNQAG